MKNKKVLFIYTNFWTFVRTDFEILSANYPVKTKQFKLVKGLFKNFIQFTKQLIFLVLSIWKYQTIYIWFADYHSFLPILFAKFLGKKSYLVIGGYDIARDKNLKYGVFRSKIRSFCAVYSMNNCTLNLTVSQFVDRKVKWIARKSKTHILYNCVNLPNKTNENQNKENLIITVGLIDTKRTFYIKGIDTFIEVAKLLPEYRFKIIGVFKSFKEKLDSEVPSNLELIEPLEHKELELHYKQAKIYCQLSRIESFGVAIIESIYQNCIPIITNVGGMPEIVSNKDLMVKRDNILIAKKIEAVLDVKPTEFNFEIKKFDFNTRKGELLQILD